MSCSSRDRYVVSILALLFDMLPAVLLEMCLPCLNACSSLSRARVSSAKPQSTDAKLTAFVLCRCVCNRGIGSIGVVLTVSRLSSLLEGPMLCTRNTLWYDIK